MCSWCPISNEIPAVWVSCIRKETSLYYFPYFSCGMLYLEKNSRPSFTSILLRVWISPKMAVNFSLVPMRKPSKFLTWPRLMLVRILGQLFVCLNLFQVIETKGICLLSGVIACLSSSPSVPKSIKILNLGVHLICANPLCIWVVSRRKEKINSKSVEYPSSVSW